MAFDMLLPMVAPNAVQFQSIITAFDFSKVNVVSTNGAMNGPEMFIPTLSVCRVGERLGV